jgi:serine phosphatase RsbU (regulator of sigma subunit)
VAVLELHIEAAGAAPLSRTFDAESLVIGRKAGADIVVDDASVSRRHARLLVKQGEWFVEDLQSRNGSRLNGQPISEAVRLKCGDVIRVGDTVVRVVSAGNEAPPAQTTIEAPTSDETLFSVLKPASELLGRAGEEAGAAPRLRLLNEVHRALAAPISREELLQLILDRAFAVLEPEDAAVFLKGANGELHRAAERRSARSSGALLVSRRLAEEVTVKGAAALVLDAQVDERFALAESVIMSGVRSILAAPLSDAGGCLGMIALYSNVAARRFSEQDLELLVSLASAAALRIRNIALVEQEAERRVFDRELALAREIQMGMLRRQPLGRSDVDVAARQVPARQVGGDFYEYMVDAGRLWFIVADVSGKGMAAALMMAMSQTLFRAIAALRLPLDEVMTRLNGEVARDNERGMFVTALAGCLDLATGRLELADAGHNLPYLLRRNGTVDVVAARNALALGVREDVTFPVTELVLEPGDGLVLYTDGVCDALDPNGVAFGTAGLERHLRTAARRPAGEIVDGVFQAVQAFAGSAAQEDDITVVVIRYGSRLAVHG